MKHVIRSMLPGTLLEFYRRLRKNGFYGDFPNWAAAMREAGGYDAPAILERVREAALKVRRGEAVFERDSVCFDHEQYRWPTLACLLRVAAEHGGRLNVADFGGSLGSFYFQHKKHFGRLGQVRWAVVEQPHYVDCGRADFAGDALQFYTSLEACLDAGPADVILCSSVLQYLESPYETLAGLAASDVPCILLDRTPFIAAPKDRLCVHMVPSSIYAASYPAWFFSWQRFVDETRRLGLSIEAEFPADDDVGIGEFKGVMLVRA